MKPLKILVLLLLPCTALAEDPRFCGAPARDARGEIIRSASVLKEFERRYPPPPPIVWPGGMTEGWYRDHVIPLACGGCDSVANLQWLPESAWRWKARWERRVYGGRGMSEGCP